VLGATGLLGPCSASSKHGAGTGLGAILRRTFSIAPTFQFGRRRAREPGAAVEWRGMGGASVGGGGGGLAGKGTL